VLTPRLAVYWAATFNFLAVFIFGTAVAQTMGHGMVRLQIIDYWIICAALTGAIVWNLITWRAGLPSSSSHALVGGLVGAGFAKAGLGALVWSGISKTLVFIVVAPLLGLGLGLFYMVLLAWLLRRATPRRIDRVFRRGQLLSAALYSLGHGGNDAQKTAGIIWSILAAANMMGNSTHIPFWVLLLCHIAMGLGIPVSTTHVITGTIVGVGATMKLSSVRWGIAGHILWAWVLTIPAAAGVAIVMWYVLFALGIAQH
jgi:PiT family inorganic phosphate transporter